MPPHSFERHDLDADGLMGEAPFWGPFWEHPMFSEAERSRDAAVPRGHTWRSLAPRSRSGDAFSLIHADLHPGNVLVDGDRLAVIDFDDAAFGWHLYDLAVALVFYQDHVHYEGFRDACLRGYVRLRSLPDDVARLLPMFLLIRCLVQIGWLNARPELPERGELEKRKNALVAQVEAFAIPC